MINDLTGEDIKIKDLGMIIKDILGFNGTVVHDLTKPNDMLNVKVYIDIDHLP